MEEENKSVGHFADVETYRPKVLELATAAGVTVPLTMDVHFVWMPFVINLMIDLEHAREETLELQKNLEDYKKEECSYKKALLEGAKVETPVGPIKNRPKKKWAGRGRKSKENLVTPIFPSVEEMCPIIP